MASLNDFFRMEVKSAPRRRSLAPGRYLFLIQLLVAALLVLGVWQFGDKQNTLGLAARYVKGRRAFGRLRLAANGGNFPCCRPTAKRQPAPVFAAAFRHHRA